MAPLSGARVAFLAAVVAALPARSTPSFAAPPAASAAAFLPPPPPPSSPPRKSSIRSASIASSSARALPSRLPLSLRASSSSSASSDDAESSSSPSPPSALRTMKLYNSLTRTKEPFSPLSPPLVTMYTCGPTVYDDAHVGNFRAFLTYDVLKRVLTYFGYDVDHVCNLTDVDDKIIARCDAEKIGLLELTRRHEGRFMDDLDALNVVKARVYPRATEHIPEMVRLIRDLEREGLAYQSEEGSWYFDVGKKDGYGRQLVTLDLAGMKPGASGGGGARRGGTDADEYDADKLGPRDFALWKSHKPNFDRDDATWDTEIGRGRPGWHLECSAMARTYLGDSIDVHCGGIDLKFPHHENEIAQSEGATGKKFCSCWLHNGFVNVGDEKMSKSKGNFLTLRTACPTSLDVRAYRYLVTSSQYRNPLSFTSDAVRAARGALRRMDDARRSVDDALNDVEEATTEEEDEGDDYDDGSDLARTAEEAMFDFETAIADDLAMPRASAALFKVVKSIEAEFKRVAKLKDDDDDDGDVGPPLDRRGLASARDALDKMDEVFGIFYDVPPDPRKGGGEDGETAATTNDDGSVPKEVSDLVTERIAAKESKDWDRADELRVAIRQLGYDVKDVRGGEPIVSRNAAAAATATDEGGGDSEGDDGGGGGSVPREVMDLVTERIAAKESKDWDRADELRNEIRELGYEVKDVKGGGEPIVSRT